MARRRAPRVRTLCVLLGAAFAVTVWAPLPQTTTTPPPPAASDVWGGVPWCTDAIADAGGVCHGEP